MNRNQIINYLLLNSKKSIGDIADHLGINRSNIYLWKNQKTKPKTDHINRLAEFTGFQIKWLNNDNIKIIETDQNHDVNPDVNINYLQKTIHAQSETISLQKEKITHLEGQLDLLSEGKQNTPYPNDFNELVDMVESSQNTWEWSFNESPTPMAMSDKYNLIRANQALLTQLEYSDTHDFIGRPIIDVIHPDDRNFVKKKIEKNIRKFNARILKGNGSYCMVKINSRVFNAQFGKKYSVAHIHCIDHNCSDIIENQ